MKNTLSHGWSTSAAFLLAISAAILTTPVTHAGSQSNTVIIPQIGPAQLHNLQSRQQRLDFQQRQQINRELDSLSIGRQQPRIEIPVMKPGCRPRQVGSSYIAQTC